MSDLLRRIRGVVGTGLIWGLGWAGIFGVLGAILGAYSVPALALTGGFTGFIAGSAFGVILSISERGHRLKDLSLWRMALWGGLGGVLVAGAFNLLAGSGGIVWPFVATMAFSGAVSSTGTVAIAKRADTRLIKGQDDSAFLPKGK